jgi:hypothetical protein
VSTSEESPFELKPPPPPFPRRHWTFSLGTLMLLVTLVAVALGLAAAHPGLGILFAILATPAGVRTAINSRRRTLAGAEPGLLEKSKLFCTSFCIVTVLSVATWAAFGVTCTATFWGPVWVLQNTNISGDLAIPLLVLAVIAGVTTGALVAYFAGRRLWPCKR